MDTKVSPKIEYKAGILPSSEWKMELTRKAYGEMLVELGEKNPDIVVLDADLAESTFTKFFRERFPERFIECGISEQDMMNTAAGLSTWGFIPFLSSYAIFLTGRAWDQMRNTVDYSNLNVKIAAAHGGISVGKDGCSHQSMEDLGNVLSLVNMTVVMPADYWETRRVMEWIPTHKGPLYMRLGREKVPMVTTEQTPFIPGKAIEVVGGNDGTFIACGLMLSRAVRAAEILAQEGIYSRVLNMPMLKPIDKEAIYQAAKETGAIVTIEEHSIYGGLGSIVARILIESPYRVPTRIIGIPDIYLRSGDPEQLLELAGLTAENAAAKMKEALSESD